MTLDQFLEKLAETPRDWRLNSSGTIRASCWCPIERVCGALRFGDTVWTAADDIGLSRDDAQLVVDAADDTNQCDRVLRARLLAACDLQES